MRGRLGSCTALDGFRDPLELTVIVEYGLPASTEADFPRLGGETSSGGPARPTLVIQSTVYSRPSGDAVARSPRQVVALAAQIAGVGAASALQ